MIHLFNKYHKNRKKLDIVHLWFGLCVWLIGETQNNEGLFGHFKDCDGFRFISPHAYQQWTWCFVQNAHSVFVKMLVTLCQCSIRHSGPQKS